MAPPPMAPPTLTSAATTPRKARNPWRRQRPRRTPTPPTPPAPDGDYPRSRNISSTNNQYTTRGTPLSPTPPRHLSHLHHRRRRGRHHPSCTAPSRPPQRPAHKRYGPTTRNNTLTIDTTGNTTYAHTSAAPCSPTITSSSESTTSEAPTPPATKTATTADPPTNHHQP